MLRCCREKTAALALKALQDLKALQVNKEVGDLREDVAFRDKMDALVNLERRESLEYRDFREDRVHQGLMAGMGPRVGWGLLDSLVKLDHLDWLETLVSKGLQVLMAPLVLLEEWETLELLAEMAVLELE